ncbi:MAG: right-handed parallel beta-helix repeat-containing protein [Candidatus Eremiobacteraeota bacterium]|nr:right-handed parallel beta-helix repeat-containing protein [Candidatus Eremiobacteraeota bacterium]
MATALWSCTLHNTTLFPASPGIATNSGSSAHGYVFNVRDYGAKGNGRTDDTQAIARALNAAIARGGGTVFFPKGIYDIVPAEGPFFVASNIEFAGVGRDSVLRVADDAGQYNLIFGQHPGRVHDVAFRDLRFDQNPSGNRTADINPQTDAENVIQLYSFDGVLIHNVAFNPEPGIQAIVAAGPNQPSHLTVSNCSFNFVRGKSSNPYYDESSVYTEAGYAQIENDRFETTNAQNAITAIELHGGPYVTVENNSIHEFENGVNLEESTNGYPEVPAAHFKVTHNAFEDTAMGIDLWSNAPRVLRDVTISENAFSFSQHHLYHNLWIGIEFQPGGRKVGLGGNFDGITVDNNSFDFSPLRHQRIATTFSAAFDLAPDGRVRHFSARHNRAIDPPAAGINVGKISPANKSEDVLFQANVIDGAGWDLKAPPGERSAVVLRDATMRDVHADGNTIVAPARTAGIFSFIALPNASSTGVTLRYDGVKPPGLLAHRVSRRVDTTGTTF